MFVHQVNLIGKELRTKTLVEIQAKVTTEKPIGDVSEVFPDLREMFGGRIKVFYKTVKIKLL